MALLAIPPPEAVVPRWHVAPWIDASAYAFSWLWVLVPLLLLGDTQAEYLPLFILITGITDVHRHFGLPYAYLDAEVRRGYPLRFLFLPVVLAAAFVVSPGLAASRAALSLPELLGLLAYLIVVVQVVSRDGSRAAPRLAEVLSAVLRPLLTALVAALVAGFSMEWGWLAAAVATSTLLELGRARAEGATLTLRRLATPLGLAAVGLVAWRLAPAQTIPARALTAAVFVVAGVWNFWHVYMQKYGILRLYAAKSGAPAAVPGYVDRLLVFAWVPLIATWVVPAYRDVALRYFGRARLGLDPTLALIDRIQAVAAPLSALVIVVAVALFLVHERRATGLRNAPRLVMAGGIVALNTCFLVFDPVKVYLAFAFSHAIEYMVFVWAFQRRRYREPSPDAPLLGELLRRPLLAYGGFILSLGAAFVLLKYWGRHIHPLPQAERPALFGHSLATWVSFWTAYQSLLHFYMDGFLWKIRRPALRASL